MPETERVWLEGGTERAWLEGTGVSEGAPDVENKGSATCESLPTIFATLTCGHDILWSDPDADVNGSEFCAACGLWVGVAAFHESAGER